ASATIPELSPHTFTANATDSDVPAQSLTFSLVGAPAGATIDGSTGAFSWTPTEAQGPGSYPFTVRVGDGAAVTGHPLSACRTGAGERAGERDDPGAGAVLVHRDRDGRGPAGAGVVVLARGRAGGGDDRRQHRHILLDAERGAGTRQLSVHGARERRHDEHG